MTLPPDHPNDAERWRIVDTSTLPVTEVAPGISRWSMPAGDALSVWLIEFAPGTRWPVVDHHDTIEEVFVIEGDFEDEGRRYGAGAFLHFEPGTSHQPSTETGGRMFGYNFRA